MSAEQFAQLSVSSTNSDESIPPGQPWPVYDVDAANSRLDQLSFAHKFKVMSLFYGEGAYSALTCVYTILPCCLDFVINS